jgi:DNA-binding MarR family transcriptional regulator
MLCAFEGTSNPDSNLCGPWCPSDSQIEVARHLNLNYSTVSRLLKSVAEHQE